MAGGSTVKVTFLGDAQGLARAAQMAQGQMDKVSQSVGRATKIGSFFGSAAGNLASSGLGSLQSFATGSVDAFARIEDATGAAGVQFGDQLPKITAFAESAAQSLGMSKGAALDAANTFGTLGKAAGLGGEDLSGFATDLTSLSGDLASFKGTSTQQAIDAVGAALRGESEPIRAYGVMLDEATLKAEAMSMGLLKATKNSDAIKSAQMRQSLAQQALNKATKEHGANSAEAQRAQLTLTTANNGLKKATEGTVGPMTQAQKILAAQSAIAKQTGDAQGDFARTSDSTANTQKRLAAETENAQASLGQKLAPAMTALRELALKLVNGFTVLADGVGKAGALIASNKTTFAVIAGVITAVVLPALARAAIGYARTAAAAVASAARQAAAWLMTQAAAYRSIAAHARAFAVMIAGWIRAGAQAMAQAARMAAAWLIAIGPIAIAIAAVVGAVVLIIKNWDKIKAATAKAWDYVKSLIGKAISGVVTILTNFTGVGLVVKHWDKIVAYIKAVPGKLANLVSDFVSMGKDMITGMARGILDSAGQVIDAIKSAVTDKLPGFVKSALGISSPSKVFREIGREVPNGMAEGIKDRANKVREAMQGIIDKGAEKLKEIKAFAYAIRDAFVSTGNVTGFQLGGEEDKSLVEQLRERAAAAREFTATMARLRQLGLNETTLGHLREAGPEGGLKAARDLLTGGTNVAEINALTRQIAAAGLGLGANEAQARYGVGINENLHSLNRREQRIVFDLRGADDDMKRLIRKWVRQESGGSVQKAFGVG